MSMLVQAEKAMQATTSIPWAQTEEEVAQGKLKISPAGRGFALLEVLVAVAILGLGSTVLLAALSQSHTFLERNRTRKLALLEAQTIFTEYQLGLGSEEGVIGGTPFSWQLTESNTEQGPLLSLRIFEEKEIYRFETIGTAP